MHSRSCFFCRLGH